MEWLVDLSSHAKLDMEEARFFTAEELDALEYGGRALLGKPVTHKWGFEFAPIVGAPDSMEALRQRLGEQFSPELVEEEWHFALEGSGGGFLPEMKKGRNPAGFRPFLVFYWASTVRVSPLEVMWILEMGSM